jgi:hypothetical protein
MSSTRLFRRDFALWKKISGAGFVTGFVVTISAWDRALRGQLPIPLTIPTFATILVISADIGALLALALSLKDVVTQRVANGQPVNPILRVYLGMGIWSLVAWFPTILVAALVISLATL